MTETLLQKAQRLGIQPAGRKNFGQKVLDVGTSVSGALGFEKATDVLGAHLARAGVGPATAEEAQLIIQKRSSLETVGAGLQVGSTLLPGSAGANLLRQIVTGAATGYLYDVGSNLLEGEKGAGALKPGATTLVGGLIPPVLKGAGKLLGGVFKRGTKVAEPLLEEGKTALTGGVEKLGQAVTETKIGGGVVQGTKEIAERIPRFVGRVQEGFQEAAERGVKIRESEPIVQQALKSGLDERIINTVQQADEPTKKAFKEIIDIAEDTGTTLKPKQRPEIVAGKAAGEQYSLIEKQRKTIGAKIGDAVKKLSQKTIVPMQKTFAQLDNVLIENGITPVKGKLTFAGRFTPAERTRIQQLYTLARESGQSMTPRQVYDMDQLFSKLQRETRMEGLGDILVDVGDGEKMSLFRVFRDVFTNTLDEVSPEDIRALNKAYRNIITLQDDIENSIIKRGKFETTKGVDPAEFAQTNLRRILSDAQSATDYREILEELDAVSRKLGYQGARADDLIAFATEMRKLYPETIPPTGFQGGIRTSLMDIAKGVLEAGKPNIKDQQKALRELLESLSK